MAWRGGVRERQPDMQWGKASLRPGAYQRKTKHESGEAGRNAARPHCGKSIAARGPGEQAEGEQQRHGPQSRHNNIDESGPCIVRLLMMRHHERPGGKRHELP